MPQRPLMCPPPAAAAASRCAAALRRGLALALLALLGLPLAAGAALREVQLQVPVRVESGQGTAVLRNEVVTVFDDDANPHPAPLAVLSHGRATTAASRAQLGRARLARAARWLTAHGFIVAVPTRIGYGATGGPDLEGSGRCDARNYPPAFGAAAQQVLQVAAALQQRPGVAPDRWLLLGQSFGGATTLAAAAQRPAGLVAAINFSGGGGGDPVHHPDAPCSPERMADLFAVWGAQVQVPTLWLYTENDHFFGSAWPLRWHQRFVSAGGQTQWVQFGPHGEDGHHLFHRYPDVWAPVVAGFLAAQRFSALRAAPMAPARKADRAPS